MKHEAAILIKSGTKVQTDYPFTELGDVANKPAPIRQIIFLSYDGDKYCNVLLPNGQESEVKCGYLDSI